MCNRMWTPSLNHMSHDRSVHDAAQTILPTASRDLMKNMLDDKYQPTSFPTQTMFDFITKN